MDVTASNSPKPDLHAKHGRDGDPKAKHVGFDLFLNLSKMISAEQLDSRSEERVIADKENKESDLEEARQLQDRNRRDLEQRRARRQQAEAQRKADEAKARQDVKDRKELHELERQNQLAKERGAVQAAQEAQEASDRADLAVDRQDNANRARDKSLEATRNEAATSEDNAHVAKQAASADDESKHRTVKGDDANRDDQTERASTKTESVEVGAEPGLETKVDGLSGKIGFVDPNELGLHATQSKDSTLAHDAQAEEFRRLAKVLAEKASSIVETTDGSMLDKLGFDGEGESLQAQSKLSDQVTDSQRLTVKPVRVADPRAFDVERLIDEAVDTKKMLSELASENSKPRSAAEFFAAQNKDIANHVLRQQNQNMAGAGSESPDSSTDKWSKLLRQGGLFDRLKSSTRKAFGDSVQLSNGATKGQGVDASSSRIPLSGVVPHQGKGIAPVQTQVSTQAQAASSVNLPDGVDEMSILRQISDGLRLGKGRSQTAQIQLRPSELGTVQVRIEMQGATARILVSADSSAVGDVLSNGLEQLRKDMLAQGVQVTHLEVRSDLNGHDGRGTEGDEQADDSESSENSELEQPVRKRLKRSDGRLHVQA